MEENKVATDKELRERADKIASVYGDDLRVIRDLAEAVFRELVAVRDQGKQESPECVDDKYIEG